MAVYKRYVKNPNLKFKTQEELCKQIADRVHALLEIRGIPRRYLKAQWPKNYASFLRAMNGKSVTIQDITIFATVLGVRVSDILGEEPINVILERPTLRMIAEELIKFEKLAPHVVDIPIDLLRVLADGKMQEFITEKIRERISISQKNET